MEEININYNFSGFLQIYTGIGGFADLRESFLFDS